MNQPVFYYASTLPSALAASLVQKLIQSAFRVWALIFTALNSLELGYVMVLHTSTFFYLLKICRKTGVSFSFDHVNAQQGSDSIQIMVFQYYINMYLFLVPSESSCRSSLFYTCFFSDFFILLNTYIGFIKIFLLIHYCHCCVVHFQVLQ